MKRFGQLIGVKPERFEDRAPQIAAGIWN